MPKEFDALSYSLVEFFDKDDHTDTYVFHEGTKVTRTNYAELSRRNDAMTRDAEFLLMTSRAWKVYAGSERVKLPETTLDDISLGDAIRGRRSHVGAYTGQAVALQQLAAMLRWSYGITRSIDSKNFPGQKLHYRASASAGALYPLEIYPLVFNVDGLAAGIYHYAVPDNELEIVRRGSPLDALLGMTTYYEMIRTSAAVIVITAVLPRAISKYLFRGYRFISYDVGVLLQSLYLTGAGAGVGTCAVGGFFDNEIGGLLGVDNVDEQVMMIFSIGQVGEGRGR
jgi:SagB-type dehydrogenase family enzyme